MGRQLLWGSIGTISLLAAIAFWNVGFLIISVVAFGVADVIYTR